MNKRVFALHHTLTDRYLHFKIFSTVLICFFFCAILSSCASYKNVAYFKDFPDTAKRTSVETSSFKSPVIKPDDLLSITIQTVDPDVSAVLNSANSVMQTTSATTTSQQQTLPGYLVDKNGEVELPFVGKMKLEGYTTVEARDAIREAMLKYVKNPIVNVKFNNFKVTVLGEVLKPATYIMPTEKVTVFDALGQAGDLTIYARRENILVIRDSLDNKKNMVHLNLNSKDIMSSPYFYLQPNDVVYVEPNESKARSTDAVRNRNITILASVLSILIIVASRINY
ncbi:MAG TPA: polysaccharide biosynthesis/export family protein [Parafilimonas sp.]|nr:polysaccharide biosynthesis/export family protein [Parafilimonas sp.]